MIADPHPTYPNPTIQEAICEIQFRLKGEISWNPSWYGDFYKAVEERFPVILPISTPQFRFEISQSASPTPVLMIPQVMRYQAHAGNLLLQVSEGRIVVNVLPDYPGWVHVREYIEYAWNKIRKVVDPRIVTRMTIRYINRIERREPDEKLGVWLVANEFVPSAVLSSQANFISRVEVRLNTQDSMSVTVSDREVSPEGEGAFILDIEHTTEHEISVDTELLLQEVTRLHESVWEVFQSTKSARLEQLLQGEIL
jgi:uncharacterized protein (TIGR04255 family)